ncbi:MAG: TIGR03643 family protein [Bacteroidetes bacterium]|nr:TIGR03643 family protein [Bacteroidota bacterium]MBK8658653.1 TIGR03643 family protein [Bacteroidota bacterium]
MHSENDGLICEYSGLPSPLWYQTVPAKQVIAAKGKCKLDDADKDRIIQMAWEDRTPFEAIEFQFGLKEKDVIEFMRQHSLPSSFRMWRKRMRARKTKHTALRNEKTNRFKCSRQKASGNKITKR